VILRCNGKEGKSKSRGLVGRLLSSLFFYLWPNLQLSRGGPNNSLYKPFQATFRNTFYGSENAYRIVDN